MQQNNEKKVGGLSRAAATADGHISFFFIVQEGRVNWPANIRAISASGRAAAAARCCHFFAAAAAAAADDTTAHYYQGMIYNDLGLKKKKATGECTVREAHLLLDILFLFFLLLC